MVRCLHLADPGEPKAGVDMNAIEQTKGEVRLTNKVKQVVGHFIGERLTIEERAALGLNNSVVGAASDVKRGDDVVELLRKLAAERIAAKRDEALARSPLIAERFQSTLARSIARAFAVGPVSVSRTVDSARGQLGAAQWGRVVKSALQTAYMTGGPAEVALSEAHPGSASGVVVVDLRDLAAFADRDGLISAPSILARVKGAPRP